ncbi:Protein of unknown function [Soonwooa buanensis]|uniref:DUF3822 domain-containing protein n=1 Tax=Soonwooa buanensis TaxID=619805 RepID=A0A1T5EVM1_9FLAO|nr:DUF3822 family protein [Soonwooa buanensis]SKB87997.1 Protein of unknown function [Soonwooa buanensis]
MQKLSLLFMKDGLQWQILKAKKVIEEKQFFVTEESPANLIEEALNEVLSRDDFQDITVLSTLNHFTVMPEGFDKHNLGFDLIAYNADVDKANEELMLSINKKFDVQFYYSFPKNFYKAIKAKDLPTYFNFTGEKFLNTINNKHKKEIHINLYKNQVEFFALENKKVVLYNNLDASSEVDFLYFIMFTLSKIGFGINDTYFYIYGETSENDTFISELQKFAKHMKILFDNLYKKSFILNA